MCDGISSLSPWAPLSAIKNAVNILMLEFYVVKLKLNFCAHEICVKTNRKTDKKQQLWDFRPLCATAKCVFCNSRSLIGAKMKERVEKAIGKIWILVMNFSFSCWALELAYFFLITFFLFPLFDLSDSLVRVFFNFSHNTHSPVYIFFCTNNKAVNCQKKLPYTERQLHADSKTCVGKMCAAVA